MKKAAMIYRAEIITDELGYECFGPWKDEGEDREFEDDGSYQVVRGGLRVAFSLFNNIDESWSDAKIAREGQKIVAIMGGAR